MGADGSGERSPGRRLLQSSRYDIVSKAQDKVLKVIESREREKGR